MKKIYIVVSILSILMLVTSATAIPNIKIEQENKIDKKEFVNDLITFLMEHPKGKLDPSYMEGFEEFYEVAYQLMCDCCGLWGENPIGYIRGSIRIFIWLFLPMRIQCYLFHGENINLLRDLTDEEREELGLYGIILFYLIIAPLTLFIEVPLLFISVRATHYDVFLDMICWCSYRIENGG